MTITRKLCTLIIIIGAITAFVMSMIFISHEMKPKRFEYQKAIASSGHVKEIFLVNNGWHTDIILKMDDVSVTVLPEKRLFSGKEYMSVGWGDAGFYQAKEITPALAADALLKSTDTVVHMAGLDKNPKEEFPAADMVAVKVSKRGFDKMMRAVSRSVKRYSMLSATPISKGLVDDSHFLRGMGKYHLFNTCNHWTARMLKAAELPVSVTTAFTSKNVMWQASRYGSDAEVSSVEEGLNVAMKKISIIASEVEEITQ